MIFNESIIGLQIIGILFALFMLYITYLHQKRKEFTSKESFVWFGAWVLFLLISIAPTGLDFFIKGFLGLGRRIDFFIILGFMFLIGMSFHTYTLVRQNQNKIDKIVRKVALEKARK
jgi:hypothetical protein